jgi:hypothetical protein
MGQLRYLPRYSQCILAGKKTTQLPSGTYYHSSTFRRVLCGAGIQMERGNQRDWTGVADANGRPPETIHKHFRAFPCSLYTPHSNVALEFTDSFNAGAGRKDMCYTSSHQYDPNPNPNARERTPTYTGFKPSSARHVRRQIKVYYTEEIFDVVSEPSGVAKGNSCRRI